MKEIKAYKCGYCGKLYQRKPNCAEHEDKHCLKNPKIRPMCFDCEHRQRLFIAVNVGSILKMQP